MANGEHLFVKRRGRCLERTACFVALFARHAALGINPVRNLFRNTLYNVVTAPKPVSSPSHLHLVHV